MKKYLASVLIGLFLVAGSTKVDGTKKSAPKKYEFKWLKFDQAESLQKESGKIIILNFYSPFCGWCKRMNTVTYGDSLVQEEIAKGFLPVIIDLRSKDTLRYKNENYTEGEFASLFGIRGTPTTGFMDTTGTLIVKVPGFVPPEGFIYLLKYIKGGWYKELSFEEFYESEKELEKQRR